MYKLVDPPRFEHGFPAPEARVISRLHYGSNDITSALTNFNRAGTIELQTLR